MFSFTLAASHRTLGWFAASFFCAALSAAAQPVEVHRYHFSSGSGVVVDMLGHVVTNRHVLRKDCARIAIVIEGNEYPAQLVAEHPSLDLALLRSPTLPSPKPLPLRDPRLPPNAKEEVQVLGYPGEAAVRNELKSVVTSVLANEGPMKEPYWLQFHNAAQHGNSGGPLVDRGGNVVGIVQAKTEITHTSNVWPAPQKSSADVAINASEVGRFLDSRNIHYSTRWLTMTYTEDTLRRYLAPSIPNVRCIMPEGVAVSPVSSVPLPQGYQLGKDQ